MIGGAVDRTEDFRQCVKEAAEKKGLRKVSCAQHPDAWQAFSQYSPFRYHAALLDPSLLLRLSASCFLKQSVQESVQRCACHLSTTHRQGRSPQISTFWTVLEGPGNLAPWPHGALPLVSASALEIAGRHGPSGGVSRHAKLSST